MQRLIIAFHQCRLSYSILLSVFCDFRTSIVPSKYLMTLMIIVMMIGFYIFARHVSHFPPAHSRHVTLYRATCLQSSLNWD